MYDDELDKLNCYTDGSTIHNGKSTHEYSVVFMIASTTSPNDFQMFQCNASGNDVVTVSIYVFAATYIASINTDITTNTHSYAIIWWYS